MTTISASSTIGVVLTSPSYANPVVINPDVTISSNGDGVYANTGVWTIQNAGNIAASGTNGRGVELQSGGSVTNAASASISGVYRGVEISGGAGVVINDGSITSALGAGVKLQFGGSVTNAASASITARYRGIVISGGAGTVVNDGSIASPLGAGIKLESGGSVTNAVSASVTAGYRGVFIYGGVGTLLNDGSIVGAIAGAGTSGFGVELDSGGSVTNAASASIAGATSGVYLSAGGTLTNAGMIVGNTGTAVVLGGTGSNLLVLDPGFGFSGLVTGGSGASNTLELASGASAGTLTGLGSSYVGFGQITVGAFASWMLDGTNTIVAGATLTELSGANLIDTGTLENDGAIVLDPSTLTVVGLTGTGSVMIDAGSTLDAQGTIAGGETLAFGGSGAYLHLDDPGSVSGSVTNFDFGETIDLKGVDPTSVNYAGDLLSFSGGSFALALASAGTVTALASADGAYVTLACFCANTLIQTPLGERPVQELAVGDLVWTVLGETEAPTIWTGRREVDCSHHPQPRKVWPVRVAAGAFGPGRPHSDLFLSPDHAIYIGDVLIPVRHLINGSTIMQVPVERVTYYHLELAEHDVLLAEGLPAESFLDMKDGSNYANRPGPARLYPDYSARMWEAFGCARLVVTGPELEAARALVGRFAATQEAA